jgi:hypothetical protein
MATADQVKALIRSYADSDDSRFYATAMQVATQAEENAILDHFTSVRHSNLAPSIAERCSTRTLSVAVKGTAA